MQFDRGFLQTELVGNKMDVQPCSRCSKLAWICVLLAFLHTRHGVDAGRLQDTAAGGTGRGRDGWSFKSFRQRRFVLEDMQPVPARGTCRLTWYTASAPKFGNTILCNGKDHCLEPCMAGFSQLHNSSLCIQTCPAEEAGPAHLCPISRTCIRAEGVCPMQADVPFYCTVPDQFLGNCAKQSYQAVIATHKTDQDCANGTVYKDVTGKWRCVSADALPCSEGFMNMTLPQPNIGTRCQQVCPPWLVDCGEACHMPGVPCVKAPEQLCPIVPLKGCSLAERSKQALVQACQQEGLRSLAICPLSLQMHGSCGGAKLEVAAGLKQRGFLRKVEVWWGPVVGQEPLPDNYDGPMRAIRLTFSDKKDTVVFGNATHALSSSPRMTFKMDPNELVVGSDMWSSSSVMDGSNLTPLLAGFTLYTTDKNVWTAGGTTSWQGMIGNQRVGKALSSWEQHVSLPGRELGVGMPVGGAAYSSASGIHAFGIIYLARTNVKQEL